MPYPIEIGYSIPATRGKNCHHPTFIRQLASTLVDLLGLDHEAFPGETLRPLLGGAANLKMLQMDEETRKKLEVLGYLNCIWRFLMETA